MKQLVSIALLLIMANGFSQESNYVSGIVINSTNTYLLTNVNIVNVTQVTGTSTNNKGAFRIRAAVNDTLHFSYLGFKPIKVRVTKDWMRIGTTTIKMTEMAIALSGVEVTQFRLTGYLDIDIKQTPIKQNKRYSISGLSTVGYEVGNNRPTVFNRVLKTIFNPTDMLYNFFGKKPKELRKLKQMKKNDELRNLLASKTDREMLMALLQVDRVDLDEIISQCNYSKDFIQKANDLQILDAINECYEEFKLTHRNRIE